MKGCDHSTAGVTIGAALKAEGFVGVFRYAAAGRGDVNISRGEVADLQAHGIQIAIVNEHSATYLLGGYDIGHQRALEAREICRACGLEDGVIYMAGDDECLQSNNKNLASVAAALRGAGDAVGRNNVGYYGSYYVIDYLAYHEPWIKYYWQTVAWSYGHIHKLANAYQHATTSWAGGVELDNDDLIMEDWGQRGYLKIPEDAMAIACMVNENNNAEIFVQKENGEVVNTYKVRDDAGHSTGWKRDASGKHVWESLGNPGK